MGKNWERIKKRGENEKKGKKRPSDPTKLGKKRFLRIGGGKKMILM